MHASNQDPGSRPELKAGAEPPEPSRRPCQRNSETGWKNLEREKEIFVLLQCIKGYMRHRRQVGTFTWVARSTLSTGPQQDRRPGFKLPQCIILGKTGEAAGVGAKGVRGQIPPVGLILS